jgi:hypothetical protein
VPDITVYTQSGCVTSQLWLEMLRDRGIPYTQKRIGSDPAAADELRQHGSPATPTTLVDGRVLTGFHRARLAELTALAGLGGPAEPGAPAEASQPEATASPE